MFFQITTIGVEVLMAITGILALIFGRFPYRPGRPVTGVGAYVGGAILIMPLAIALPLGYAIGRDQSFQEAIGKIIFLHAGFIVGCFCTAYILAALLNNPMGGTDRRSWLKEVEARKNKRRKKRRGDEEEEDRGRRRRRRRGDDDDVPRRGRREEDIEEDDRNRGDDDDEPARRRRDADEEDRDGPPHRRRERDDDDDRITSRRPPPLPGR